MKYVVSVMNQNGNDFFIIIIKVVASMLLCSCLLFFGGGSINDKTTSLVMYVLDSLFEHQLNFIQLFDNGLPTL